MKTIIIRSAERMRCNGCERGIARDQEFMKVYMGSMLFGNFCDSACMYDNQRRLRDVHGALVKRKHTSEHDGT